MKRIKKLLYYSDLALLFKIFWISRRVFPSYLRCLNSLKDMVAEELWHVSGERVDKILRYTNLFFFIRRKLGLYDTCLMRSILSCYLLRYYGVEAKISFAALKTDKIIGHCWVNVNDQEINTPFQLIFEYP